MPETSSKSIHNWRRYPSSNWYKIDENMLFWIWRSAVAPSDAAHKYRNMCVHNYNTSRVQQPQRYLGKLTSCMTFGVHKLVRSVPFSTTHANFDNCYQHCIATCGENVSVHIYVLGTKLQQLNFINFFVLFIRSCARTLSRRFWNLRNFFDCSFRILWRHLATNTGSP